MVLELFLGLNYFTQPCENTVNPFEYLEKGLNLSLLIKQFKLFHENCCIQKRGATENTRSTPVVKQMSAQSGLN